MVFPSSSNAFKKKKPYQTDRENPTTPIYNQPASPPEGIAPPPKGKIETFTDKAGNPSGVVLSNGSTYLGLNPEDVADISRQQSNVIPPNANPLGTQQRENERLKKIEELKKKNIPIQEVSQPIEKKPANMLEAASTLSTELVGATPPGMIIQNTMDVLTGKQTPSQVLAKAADIYNTMSDVLLSRKPLKVSMAEQSFNDASTVNNNNVEMVKLGQKTFEEALREMETAEQALARLEAQTHGTNKLNLRYFTDEGASIEASIINERNILSQQKKKLIEADYAARLNVLKGNMQNG